MFRFAPSFASLGETSAGERGEGSEGEADGLAGQDGAGSRSGGAILSFGGPGSPGTESACAQGSADVVREPRDPVAHPMYKTRAEESAQPIYQLLEEPMLVTPAPLRPERPISKKKEVDIATFLEAVSAAFPRPRDPLMPRVLRARPKKSARPFLYFAEEGSGASEPFPESALETPAAVQVEKDPIEKTRQVVSLAERMPMSVAFDPILDRDTFPMEQMETSVTINASRTVEAPYDPILESTPLRSGRGKVVEINPVRPVEAHERMLIDAKIEPLEPLAKPRFPLPTEVPEAAQPRLSPSQRARLRRPAVVHDCHGRLTPVTYSLNPQGRGD